MAAGSDPRVSVIVGTRNRPDHIARCLPTILANEGTSAEIIVADQSTDTSTAHVIEAIGDPRVNLIRLVTPGKSRALNAALANCRADIIAFTDDDCTVPPDWLVRALTTIGREPSAGIVFGGLAAVPHDSTIEFVPTFLPPKYAVLSSTTRVHQAGVGANMVVRRAVFERIGVFDEQLGPGALFRSAEECDIAYRALAAGFTIVQDPSNVVLHWGTRSFGDGSVRRLIVDNYYGIGAFYAGHARRGRVPAIAALAQEIAALSAHVVANGLGARKPTGLRRLVSLLHGAAARATTP